MEKARNPGANFSGSFILSGFGGQQGFGYFQDKMSSLMGREEVIPREEHTHARNNTLGGQCEEACVFGCVIPVMALR